MRRIHALFIAFALAGAATFGVLAATRTTGLGASARAASNATIGARERKLDRLDAALRKALAERPPALPTSAPRAPQQRQQVVYRRPAPVVVVRSGSGHEDEHEGEDERGTERESDD